MQKTKLITLDLDGTLLRSDKSLSERNFEALKAASEAGVEIVPCTGRYYGGMPKVIRDLPFVRYVITINGAAIADLKENRLLDEILIPNEEAVAIMEYFDTLPVIYDCYKEKGSYMTRTMIESCESYCDDVHFIEMIRVLREPVPELKEWLKNRGGGVQKVMLFTLDKALRKKELETLSGRFENLSVSSSVPSNIEINHRDANKGTALRKLAKRLKITIPETMAFGDGLNDLPMICDAGIGVVMDNASEEVKKHADLIAPKNDEDGVAKVIEKLVLS